MSDVIATIGALRARIASATGPETLTLRADTVFDCSAGPLAFSPGMDITLLSEGSGTVLNAYGFGRVVGVDGARLALRGVGIAGGSEPGGNGGCLFAVANSEVWLDDLEITDCSALWGGGLFIRESEMWVNNVTLARAQAFSAEGQTNPGRWWHAHLCGRQGALARLDPHKCHGSQRRKHVRDRGRNLRRLGC